MQIHVALRQREWSRPSRDRHIPTSKLTSSDAQKGKLFVDFQGWTNIKRLANVQIRFILSKGLLNLDNYRAVINVRQNVDLTLSKLRSKPTINLGINQLKSRLANFNWRSDPVFTARRYASADMLSSRVCPSVCLSVCPSQAGTVPKRLNVGSRKRYMPNPILYRLSYLRDPGT